MFATTFTQHLDMLAKKKNKKFAELEHDLFSKALKREKKVCQV
jgi:hypothetical protein